MAVVSPVAFSVFQLYGVFRVAFSAVLWEETSQSIVYYCRQLQFVKCVDFAFVNYFVMVPDLK